MRYRKKMNKRSSKKYFSKTSKSHKRNYTRGQMRGGTRL